VVEAKIARNYYDSLSKFIKITYLRKKIKEFEVRVNN
jgi:hypothetical protein